MDAGTADVFQTVEYSRDKRTMETVPKALLVCILGLLLTFYLDPQPPGRTMLFAFVFMFFLAAVLLVALYLFQQIFEGHHAAIRLVALVIVILALVVLFWDRPGDLLRPRHSRYPKNLPASVLGWIVIYGSIGWIAVALYRHFFPPRPIMTLSPAGISFHVSWLKGLLIPWREIEGVGPLEIVDAWGAVHRTDNATVVVLPKAFYEQHIEARMSAFQLPAKIFFPKGASMQMMLSYYWFAVEPKDIRDPIEARWKAFRNGPRADGKPSSQAPRVYGVWSIDGSRWQAATLLVPLIGIMAVLIHAAIRQP
jgi:hypothetical protein